MIVLPEHVDLAHDKTRIKDPRDGERQATTVSAVLGRMFHQDSMHRWETQIVADEVGMGKTFVALATAYSILVHMRDDGHEGDLYGCMQKVLVVTPRNRALFQKWVHEVEEFVRRCVIESEKEAAKRLYAPQRVERFDHLIKALTSPSGPRVIVTHIGVLSKQRWGSWLKHYDLKRRFTLSALFTYWGNKFKVEKRRRLLRGGPAHWPGNPYELGHLYPGEQDKLVFEEEDLLEGLRRIKSGGDEESRELLDNVLTQCEEIAAPYRRNRDQFFRGLLGSLKDVYCAACEALLTKAIPLVIVDEAHNWKNGPSSGANNYKEFERLIAARTRRLLMLTATPFQLHPTEMLELLRIGESIAPAPRQTDRLERRQWMRAHRKEVITPVLTSAQQCSRRFARAWGRLPDDVTVEYLESLWQSEPISHLCTELYRMANLPGAMDEAAMNHVIDNAIHEMEPDVRELMRESLRLYAYNADLSKELGHIVIRHRRDTGHRLFRVGEESEEAYDLTEIARRPDSHILHSAYGIDVRGDGELPHYLLMRCVSEMKGGKGRTSLGTALTGCYSTLLYSAEGKRLKAAIGSSDIGAVYLDLLMNLVDEDNDPDHPKVRSVVRIVIDAWRRGEKTLIFCFRTNTARRLRSIIDDQIRAQLDERRKRCLGGARGLRTLRARLTGRDRDLIGLGLDRLLWSVLWATRDGGRERLLGPEELALTDGDMYNLAALGVRYGVDLASERVDRVFLHRATEHVIAQRVSHRREMGIRWRKLLEVMADEEWVRRPYGLLQPEEHQEGGDDRADYDERGVHTVYEEIEPWPDKENIDNVMRALVDRRLRARKTGQTPVIDGYAEMPSLWLGEEPLVPIEETIGRQAELLLKLHHELWELSWDGYEFKLDQRLLAMQALRRILLRESVILRLLPDKVERDEAGWARLLVRAFHTPLPGQRESMADRLAVFLEDLRSASGTIGKRDTARHALWDATRLTDQNFVALVKGGDNAETRERVFNGFNTPLLPEVLVCTSVGQEGIDLHRHCRAVVHYDLAWNPATLEQRTGRADRIGSKTFRERDLEKHEHGPYLEISVPFLAGTYDERMYEELRLRAQTFEVLTGGDFAVDYAGSVDESADEEGTDKEHHLVALPESMVEALRVKLNVWAP